MTQKLVGIFGYPLAHSISPAFQQAAFDYHGISARYDAWSTPPEKLQEEVEKLRGEQYLGANVTVPHKVQVMPYLDEIDPMAQSIGAVNTIVRQDNRLVGYNTDAHGFMKSLIAFGQFEPKGKKVLLIGAGGAARAAVFGLAEGEIASLVIANRTLQRAETLSREAENLRVEVSAISMDDQILREISLDADLIVNSSSIGMKHSDAEGMSPLPYGFISSGASVYDMVYNPQETPLLAEAKKAGARPIGGLSMLIYQGAAAFEKWTGKAAPIEVMFKAGQEALA